jgi:hypothetical protein
VDFQFRIHDADCGIFSHSGAAKIVTAADTCESLATPGSRGSHACENFFGFRLHPIGEPVFILPKIVGNAKNWIADPASVAVIRVEINKIAGIG